MGNMFERDYKTYKELKDQYRDATSEAEKSAIRARILQIQESMEEFFGSSYVKLFSLYSGSIERGNKYIDISQPHQYSEPQKLVELLARCGVKYFTFSSGWTKAVETAFAFTQAGCTLEGMTEIKTPFKSYESGEYEKKPAFLFSIESPERRN